METPQKLALDTQNFKILRQENYLYVDKTLYLQKLIANGRKYFLARPHGFGKSLTLSTLKAMFQGKIELFRGLPAEDAILPFVERPIPAINLDFSLLNTDSLKQFEQSFQRILKLKIKEYNLKLESQSLEDILDELFDKINDNFNYIVILIDNFDTPILKCINNKELLFKVDKILKLIYQRLDSYDEYIKFMMITGEQNYNTTGIFATIQNIEDISNDKEYGEILGYTTLELENNFGYWIAKNAKLLNISEKDYLQQIESNCRQYCFDEISKIYSPDVIIKCLKKCETKENLFNANKVNSTQVYSCINQDYELFNNAKDYPIYVDKSELLIYTNKFIDTDHKYICISRPRRFGKTISANMIASYYDRNSKAEKIFKDLKIKKDHSFSLYANKYIVIKLTIQDYLSKNHEISELLKNLQSDIKFDLLKQYGNEYPNEDLNRLMNSISLAIGQKFVIVIDEWDCILREFKEKEDWQREYLDFLRYLFKDQAHLALVYMTGILPIKKYGTHSALNMFDEYSMLDADPFSEFMGFTEIEVKKLCQEYKRDFNKCKRWYDGYQIKNISSIYNPRSVNCYISSGECKTYWNSTETYDALKIYITLENFGLHEIITRLLANDEVKIHTGTFSNDMKNFKSKDDVLTLLVHLGYLSFNAKSSRVKIPNQEIAKEFYNAILYGGWPKVVKAIQNSEKLLLALLNKDCETVAQGIEAAHEEMSILKYNDENSLACTLYLAFYAAREKYIITREFPSGKGFADLLFWPQPNYNMPFCLLELKWNKSTESALNQIYERNYPTKFSMIKEPILLVGVNYDPKSKKHTCEIETWQL